MCKIVLIRSNSVSPDPRIDKEASTLTRYGYRVAVLAWDRENRHHAEEIRNNYKIIRFKLKAPYGKVKLIFYLFIWNCNIFKWLLTNRWDVVHACDFDTLIPALLAAKIKRKKIVYDIFDFYGFCLPISIPTFIRYFVVHIERFFLRFPDVVIVVDKSRFAQIGNNGRELEIIMNTPKDVFKNEYPIKKTNDFIIFYAGILSKLRGFNQILPAIKGMDNISLVVAGFGEDEHELKKLFEKENKVKFIGRISYEEVINWTYRADILFALYDPKIPNHKYSSPNKLFEAMMCAKPIIVNEGTSMAKIVKEENCGLIVPYDNVNEIKNAILKLHKNPKLCKELGENGRRAYKLKYNWNIMGERLLKIYKKLCVSYG